MEVGRWKIGSPPGHGGYRSFHQDLEGARPLGAAPGDGGFDKVLWFQNQIPTNASSRARTIFKIWRCQTSLDMERTAAMIVHCRSASSPHQAPEIEG